MNEEDDLLASRISGWLSGALDPQATRAVGRLVDRDAEARRLAGGYHRVDAVVRDWYEGVPTEPVAPVAMPRRAGISAQIPARISAQISSQISAQGWQLAVAAALLIIVLPASRIDTEEALKRLFDAAAERIGDDGELQRALAPTTYWRLRAGIKDAHRPPAPP